MKLRLVMFLVIGPITLLAGFFMTTIMLEGRQTAQLAHETTLRTTEGAYVSGLIHELQKERGYSAGFIASQGANFAGQLSAQRASTEQAIASYRSQITVLSTDNGDLFSNIDIQLNALAEKRSEVDTFALTVPEMAGFYTGLINNLLAFSRPAVLDNENGRLQALLSARALVGSAKESAGLERAMGATGLGSGFSLEVHDRFVSLGGAQTALLEETSGALADPEWVKRLKDAPQFREVATARKTIGSGYATADYGDLTAADWFVTSTNWIDLLRQEELNFVEQITVLSADIEAQADTHFWWTAWGGALTVLAAFGFALFAFERMIARIKYLIGVIEKFTNGEFGVWIKGIEGRDELSKMAKAIYHFKQDTLEMRRNAEALQKDQIRVKSQQDELIKELRAGLGELAEGNLTHSFDDAFPEEYESLRLDFNATVSKLDAAMSSIFEAATSIRAGANTLNQSSDELSNRTANQAATLEETAAALEDMTGSVRTAANGAQSVQKTTTVAKTEAEESGQVVREAVDAMGAIAESAGQIANIVGVIEDIAFQTNLLALNAGVEAARAGDAGRGFAVVASEVQALANRSSASVVEIKELIGQSTAHVDGGVELVSKAGSALESIVEQVSKISTLVSEIADGAADQAVGLGEINTGVAQLDSATQKNAIMAQDANTVCGTLNVDATKLEQLVRQFQTSDRQATQRDSAPLAQSA